MHFVKKGQPPSCFKQTIAEFDSEASWSNFQNPCKTATKKHILSSEQDELCIYCERNISASHARLEHLKPQSCYSADRFNYANLVVSCHGQEDRNELIRAHKGYSIDSCDHAKGRDFDPQLFLDPTCIQNIDTYFSFDATDGAMCASVIDQQKAGYMIKLLNLNNVSLCNERLNAKTAFIKALNNQPAKKRKVAITLLLSKNNHAFISFLRDIFK